MLILSMEALGTINFQYIGAFNYGKPYMHNFNMINVLISVVMINIVTKSKLGMDGLI